MSITKGKKIESFEYGNQVWCDWSCGEEYTNSDAVGGITFGSKAICPKCAPDVEAKAKKYGEESYIRERAPEGMTFRDFVVKVLRKGEPGKTEVFELKIK